MALTAEISRRIDARWHRITHRLREHSRRLAERRPRTFLVLATLAAAGGYLALLAPALVGLVAWTRAGLALGGGMAPTAAGVWVPVLVGAAGWALFAQLFRLEFGRPEGVRIPRAAAPELGRLVDGLCSELHAARVHRIFVTEGAGIELVRTPVRGLPLGFRNQLLIGSAALQCLSRDQLRALVAGHVGEISVHNLGIVAWLCQLRQVWIQYRLAFARSRSLGARLYRPLFDFYAPAYARLTLPLGRDRVFRRDAYARYVTPLEDLAEALVMESVVARFLEAYYWPRVFRAAEKCPEPTFRAYGNLGIVFERKMPHLRPQAWVREAYHRGAVDPDHPSLRMRLDALGTGEPSFPGVPEVTALEELIGARAGRVLSELDQRWMARESENWAVRHQRHQDEHGRLAALRELAEQGELHGKRAMEYAALVKRHGTAEEAAAAYRRILEINPDDPRIQFGVGKFLLSIGDPEGVPLLEQAMERDKHCVAAACRLISEFVVHTGSQETVRHYVQQMLREQDPRCAG